jgi:hypothetical protein
MIHKSILCNIILLLTLASLSGCAGVRDNAEESIQSGSGQVKPLLAVLPVQNYSSTPAPLYDLHQAFAEHLQHHGLQLLGKEELEAFMARHRLRHVGGIGRGINRAFAEEEGVDGVIITYLEEYRKKKPPKFSLMARLIMVSDLPEVVWMDSASFAGNEAPGLLNLGLVNNINVLEERAMERLANSLVDYLAGQQPQGIQQRHRENPEINSRPRIYYKSRSLTPDKKHKIVIMPFLNESERRFAGELIGLHFLKHMVMNRDAYEVIEPGVVRNELLANRVVIPYGLSVADDELVFSQLDADLLLSGDVMDYSDPGGDNMPTVNFTSYAIAREDNEMVWSSQSINSGDEGVHIFGLDRIFTASVLSSYMTEHITRMLSQPEESWFPDQRAFQNFGINQN